jgi:hypothetical protein
MMALGWWGDSAQAFTFLPYIFLQTLLSYANQLKTFIASEFYTDLSHEHV